MKRKWILSVGAGLALGAIGLASPQGLVRLQPRSAPQARQAPDSDDLAGWRSQLCQPDLDLREQAYERALGAAARQRELRAALERWARAADDPQLAWTCRLLLRELSTARWVHGLAAPAESPPGFPDIDELWRRMAERNGSLEDLFELQGALRLPDITAPGASARSEGFQLRILPDGVECELTTEEDGRKVTRRFQAASVEELTEQHPELAERLHAAPALEWARPGAGVAPGGSSGTRVRTDILGVVVASIAPERGADLGLPEGQGLWVERVEPGTIAEALGVQRGHVLVELNGRSLRHSADISSVLAQRQPGDDLRLVLLDRYGLRRARIWKPEPIEGAAPGPALQPPGG